MTFYAQKIMFFGCDIFYCFITLYRIPMLSHYTLICLETSHELPVTSLYWKSLKHMKTTVSMAKKSRCPDRKQMVADAIPGGVIYFHFEIFAYFPSLQVGGVLANEIKHDHSPIVIVVLDPDTIHHKSLLYL